MKVLGGYNMKTYLVGGLTFHGEEVKGGGGGVIWCGEDFSWWGAKQILRLVRYSLPVGKTLLSVMLTFIMFIANDFNVSFLQKINFVVLK